LSKLRERAFIRSFGSALSYFERVDCTRFPGAKTPEGDSSLTQKTISAFDSDDTTLWDNSEVETGKNTELIKVEDKSGDGTRHALFGCLDDLSYIGMHHSASAQALSFRETLGRDLHGLPLDADGIPNLEDTVSAQTSLLSGTSSPSTESHGDNDFLGNVFSKEASMHISKALMKFFTGFIDARMGIRMAHSGGTSAKDQTADEGHGDEFEEGRAGLAIDASKASKRSRAVGHGENGAGDESDDEASRSKRVKIDGSENTKISCPFMKRNPLEFSTWRTCIGPGFDGMHRVKSACTTSPSCNHCQANND
jgi:hypothetical protein